MRMADTINILYIRAVLSITSLFAFVLFKPKIYNKMLSRNLQRCPWKHPYENGNTIIYASKLILERSVFKIDRRLTGQNNNNICKNCRLTVSKWSV